MICERKHNTKETSFRFIYAKLADDTNIKINVKNSVFKKGDIFVSDILQWQYQQKLISADEAVKLVKAGDRLWYGEFSLFPEALDEALAKRVDELHDVMIYGVSFTQPPKAVLADPERKHFIMQDFHFSKVSRYLHDLNLSNYIPNTYHQGPRITRKYLHVNALFAVAAPMDAKGFFNFGLSNSVTHAALDKADIVIVEINNNIPTCLGGNQESIHLSKIDYIVQGKNNPLIELPAIEPSATDQKIATLLLAEIQDGSCLQLGIGGLPNAVGSLIAESDLKDLGVHSEMLMDAFVDLYERGRITGARKSIDKYKMVYAFALGSKRLYDFLDYNPVCASYPVSYTNDPRIVSLNDKVMAINSALEIDLLSQVSSETMGLRQISGTGGQLDFIFGAFQSHGGKGIICLHSTHTDKEGNLHSTINPTLSLGTVVTVPRSLVQYVATEYGIVQLKGKSTYERAEALISISHPQFQDELIKAADSMKIWLRTNKIE